MYLAKSYKDSIYNTIKSSELLPNLEYKYSDLPYYILKDYIESNYKIDLNLLIDQLLFSPIGANYTSYLPLKKNLSNIVPTEVDSYFRHQEIKGYVHDMGAAMLGGVGGHAGVFSIANDVAKIMQMYLNKGKYGKKTYFSSDTIDKFNTCYFCANDNRRDVGFDKPQLSDEGTNLWMCFYVIVLDTLALLVLILGQIQMKHWFMFLCQIVLTQMHQIIC